MAETQADAQRAFDQFIDTYQDKYPKATECLRRTAKSSLASTIFRRCTGRACAPPTQLNRNLRRSVSHASLERVLKPKGDAVHDVQAGNCAQHNWRRLRGFRQLGKVIEGIHSETGLRQSSLTTQVAA